jgi:acetyltransferase-like isoleucine patch superfamily enzyme
VRSEPVSIGDGTWIGTGALILPGVHVGAGCVIAAGAVVTESVPDDTLVGGVPAKVLRQLPT